MNIETTLQRAGLTKNEIKAYLTLLKVGRTTSYSLVKEAKISSGKIYETLDKLIRRGVVSYVIIKGKRYFEASNPERLIDYMRERESEIHKELKDIQKIVPELRLRKKAVEEKTKAEIFEEISGIKTVYDLMLKETGSKDEIIILGAPKEAGEKLDIYFDNFNKKRMEKRTKLKVILNYGHPREKKLKLIKNTQVKVFPKNVITLAWINIFKDYVATFNLTDKPIVFLIKNNRIADSYREYFNLLWKQAS